MSSDIAIKVENLSKCYQIYEQPRDRLKQFVMPRLQRGLGKKPKQYYREFWALKDVSFEVKKGETVGIIGRNGSGKSTLLQIICGTLNPTGGSVTTHGRIAALLELGSGFNPDFTGRENVYMNAAVLGLSNDEIDQRFDAIAAFADIGGFIEQPVKTYSSGMMMRLAFAVIAHVNADILIVDEALSVGDAAFVQKCSYFLKTFLKYGTLILVSHSMASVLETCKRAIWLNKANLITDSSAKEVVRNYTAFIHQETHPEKLIKIEKNNSNEFYSPPDSNQFEYSKFITVNENKNFAKIFDFNPDSPAWGASGAAVLNIEILDEAGLTLQTVNGGIRCAIKVHCISKQTLINPIVGFSLRNRRGVEIIGENTSNSDQAEWPLLISAGAKFCGQFIFFLPYLPSDDYFIGGAVADRPFSEGFVQHHRKDDALRISIRTSHVIYGVFGMPMDDCQIILDAV